MNEHYDPSVATDIARSWREKYGYVPASEQPEIAAKHAMYKQYGRDITKDNNPSGDHQTG
jgi:hypothetical protein